MASMLGVSTCSRLMGRIQTMSLRNLQGCVCRGTLLTVVPMSTRRKPFDLAFQSRGYGPYLLSSSLLSSKLPLIVTRGYKVKGSLKLRCSGCRFVKRKGRLRVVCSNKPRHKQKQG